MPWLLSLFAIAALTTFTACDDDDDDVQQPSTIVDFAQESDDYTLLAEAVVAAGLDGTLSEAGPYTVFAPDNAAFEALLASNAAWSSIDDIPTDVLVAVLTNHVLADDLSSADLTTGYYSTLSATDFGSATTSLYINLDNGVTINGGPTVETADVDVSNGVIHGIDAVIGLPTIVTHATANPELATLVAALTQEGLGTDFVATLSGEGPFTVFAPTNEAFQNLLDSNDDWTTLSDIPSDVLASVLSYHVTTAGNVRAADIQQGMMVSTLAGESFTIDLGGENPTINAGANTANIIATDIQATNGVVHVIDEVLLFE